MPEQDMAARPCGNQRCANLIEPSAQTTAIYCSRRCKENTKRRRQLAATTRRQALQPDTATDPANSTSNHQRTCIRCGKPIPIARTAAAMYCDHDCRANAKRERERESRELAAYRQTYRRDQRRLKAERTRLDARIEVLENLEKRIGIVSGIIPQTHGAVAEVQTATHAEKARADNLQTQLELLTRERDWLREDIAELATIVLDRVKEPWRQWPPTVHDWVTRFLTGNNPYPEGFTIPNDDDLTDELRNWFAGTDDVHK